MPPIVLRFLLKFWPHILGLLGAIALALMIYNKGYSAGEARVQEQWAVAIANATAEAAKKEAEHEAIAKALQDELVRQGGRVDAADSRARSLAERLRQHQARRCLPQAADPAAVADPAAGVSPGSGAPGTAVDAALEEALAAAGRDAARLGAWQDWWKQVSSD